MKCIKCNKSVQSGGMLIGRNNCYKLCAKCLENEKISSEMQYTNKTQTIMKIKQIQKEIDEKINFYSITERGII